MSRKKTDITANKIFAANISDLINKECSGNLKDFGISVGASYDTVLSWTKGEYLPGGAQLVAIKEKYNYISIDKLLTDQEPAETIREWKPETQEACRILRRIIESPDQETATALLYNLKAFSISIERMADKEENDKKFNSLKKELKELKKVVARLTEVKNLEKQSGTDQGQGVSSTTGEKTYPTPVITPDRATVHEPDTSINKTTEKK